MAESAGTSSGETSLFSGRDVSFPASSLPLLANWLESMGRRQEAFSAILYAYVDLVRFHTRESLAADDQRIRDGEDLTQTAEACFQDNVSAIRRGIQEHYHPNPVPADENQAPAFADLWNEVQSSFPTFEHLGWMLEAVKCGPANIKIARVKAFILQCLLKDKSRPCFMLTTEHLSAQPILQGPYESDNRRNLPMGDPEGPMVAGCKRLVQKALAPFLLDPYNTFCVIGALTDMAAKIAKLVNSEVGRKPQGIPDIINGRLTDLRAQLWDPFRWLPLQVRKQLTQTDLKLYQRLLIIEGRKMKSLHARQKWDPAFI
jgi:hypothetical protein